jgi:hypothetical protein
MTTKYLNRREQAEYCAGRGLKITKPYLDKLASQGGGPQYVIWGNQAVSTIEWLNEWIEARLRQPRRSTSEHIEAR